MQKSYSLSSSSDISVYNKFMHDFTVQPGTKKYASYGDVKGRINEVVSQILIENINKGDRRQFIKDIKDRDEIPLALKNKAEELAKKYLPESKTMEKSSVIQPSVKEKPKSEIKKTEKPAVFKPSSKGRLIEKQFKMYDHDYTGYSEKDIKKLNFLQACCQYPKLALEIEKANPKAWLKGGEKDENMPNFIARKMNEKIAEHGLYDRETLSMKDLDIEF